MHAPFPFVKPMLVDGAVSTALEIVALLTQQNDVVMSQHLWQAADSAGKKGKQVRSARLDDVIDLIMRETLTGNSVLVHTVAPWELQHR